MADSQRLRVLKNLQTTLLAITVGAGYSQTVQAVTLDWVDLATVPLTPAIVVGQWEQGDLTWQQGGLKQIGVRKDDLRVTLYGRLDVPGSDSSRKTQAVETFFADIENAMVVDLTRGGSGNAIDTRCEQPVAFMMGLEPQNWILFEFPIAVRLQPRNYGAP